MALRRHRHSLSHHRLFTADMGQLVPIGCVENLLGDTWRHRTSMLIRVQPLAKPVMHPVNVRVHHWFVPLRLIWDEWEDFITKKAEPTYPVVTVPAVASKSELLDHLGVDSP